MSKQPPTEERFWSHVIKSDDCWIYDIAGEDYGALRVNGRRTKAHRYSWELHFGPIPNKINVLHSCDNPPCVRPDHLFLGTQLENMNDCVIKGRMNGKAKSQPGERNGMAILTWDIVDQIRKRDRSAKEWALLLDVHVMHIKSIRNGRRWPIGKHP